MSLPRLGDIVLVRGPDRDTPGRFRVIDARTGRAGTPPAHRLVPRHRLAHRTDPAAPRRLHRTHPSGGHMNTLAPPRTGCRWCGQPIRQVTLDNRTTWVHAGPGGAFPCRDPHCGMCLPTQAAPVPEAGDTPAPAAPRATGRHHFPTAATRRRYPRPTVPVPAPRRPFQPAAAAPVPRPAPTPAPPTRGHNTGSPTCTGSVASACSHRTGRFSSPTCTVAAVPARGRRITRTGPPLGVGSWLACCPAAHAAPRSPAGAGHRATLPTGTGSRRTC